MSISSDLITILLIVFVYTPLLIGVVMLAMGLLFGDHLSNNPNRFMPKGFDQRNLAEDGRARSDLPYHLSDFGLFTDLADERAKLIVAGKTFRDIIMHYPGHTFYGLTKAGKDLRRKDKDYWRVVKTPPGEKDLPAIGYWPFWSFKSLLLTYRLVWWAWQKILFEVKGLVFVGFWPWRKIRVYRLEYFVSNQDGGEFGVERHVSYSDHIRVGPFQFYIPIGSAETLDLLAIKNVISQLMWSNNPYKSSYHTDDNWGSFLFARFSSVLTRVINRLGIHDALTSNTNMASDIYEQLWPALEELIHDGGPIDEIGFSYNKDGLTIPDRSAQNKETADALAAEALAKAKARAEVADAGGYAQGRRIRAQADADAVTMNAEAINNAGLGGIQVAQIEGGVRQVQAAPQGAVVIVGGAAQNITDPAVLALLAKLQAQKEGE